MENYSGTPKEIISFEGKIIVVEHAKTCAEAVKYLAKQTVIGFDTETRPSFTREDHKVRRVALLQLSDDKRAYLFRLNKIGFPEDVRNLLANTAIVKVGAAIHDDIKALQRLAPFTPSSFIDLQKMAEDYGITQKALKTLSEIVLDVTISKKQRLTDWESYKLTESQQRYAATDAWICHKIYLKLLTTDVVR
ncbi:MAG: 3'-5' exonuclease domain-containing protein 2 [Prevotellaceae bacterium]|jgi:ribonuclease D|nr:3'-5' exonuclease domain-containing protein 2 [Prevotellaceae bacterium]